MRLLFKILLVFYLGVLYPSTAGAVVPMAPVVIAGISFVAPPVLKWLGRQSRKGATRVGDKFVDPSTLRILRKNIDFQVPYWMATKDGKTLWLVGLAMGIPLESQDCSAQIEDQLMHSDLALLGQKPLGLSWEEKRTISLGPFEEKQAILARLSDEDRIRIEEQAKTLSQFFSQYFSTQSLSKCSSFSSCLMSSVQGFSPRSTALKPAEELFESLTPETQDFLRSFQQEEDSDMPVLWDSLARMILTINQELYFSMPEDLIHQTGEIALSRDLPTEYLIDNILDLSGLLQIEERKSLTPEDIEQLVSHSKTYRAQIRSGELLNRNNPEHLHTSLSEEEAVILDERLRPQNEYLLETFKTALADTESDSIFMLANHINFIGSSSIQNMLEEEGFSIQPVECEDKRGI